MCSRKIEHNILALRIPDYFLSRTKWLPVKRRGSKCILLTSNGACSHQTKANVKATSLEDVFLVILWDAFVFAQCAQSLRPIHA